jgi:hypothetical protein
LESAGTAAGRAEAISGRGSRGFAFLIAAPPALACCTLVVNKMSSATRQYMVHTLVQSRWRRDPPGRLKSNFIQGHTREAEASSHDPGIVSCPNSRRSPHVGVNNEFRTQRQQHLGDARPSLSAAVVAAVTRNPWNCSPSCDAFRRICRSDASSSTLSRFGLKLERHV